MPWTVLLIKHSSAALPCQQLQLQLQLQLHV